MVIWIKFAYILTNSYKFSQNTHKICKIKSKHMKTTQNILKTSDIKVFYSFPKFYKKHLKKQS